MDGHHSPRLFKTLSDVIKKGKLLSKKGAYPIFLSSLNSGLIIGVASMAIALFAIIYSDVPSPLERRLYLSIIYPIGFILCLLSNSHLYTEMTAMAFFPYIDKKITFTQLVRIWTLILLGNLLGTYLSSLMIISANDVIQAVPGYAQIISPAEWPYLKKSFLSSILAGWLMAHGGWVCSTHDSSVFKIIIIYLTTFLIGVGGLHHSIMYSAEIFTYLLSQGVVNIPLQLLILFVCIIGNLIGGVVFVGLLNYGHITNE